MSRAFASLNGNWTFERADDTTLTTGQVLTTEEHSASVGGGVEFVGASGATLRARGDWFVEADEDLFTSFDIDDRLTGWTAAAGFGVPISLFGWGVPGTFNLDVSGNTSAASARADVTVPLN